MRRIFGEEHNLTKVFFVKNYDNNNFYMFFLFSCYTVRKIIDFPRYNMKCSGENVILHGIVHVVSGFPLHLMLYRGNLDCFSNKVGGGELTPYIQ